MEDIISKEKKLSAEIDETLEINGKVNSKFLIKGGNPLHGNVKVNGAKNSVLKLIPASLLTAEKSVFHNVPNKISDLVIIREICSLLGSEYTVEDDNFSIETSSIRSSHIPFDLGNATRAAILMAGPLLVRTGKAEIPIPGGCKIGARPLNFHIEALRKLGANVKEDGDYYVMETGGLKGTNIHLEYPSVGATENVIIASTLAKGRTILSNAAVEPEIIDLIKYLQNMGAIIEISTDRKITIEGVEKLYGAEHSVIPDRIVAGSFASAAIASKGDVFVEGARQEDLITFLNAIRRMGGKYKVMDNGIRFYYEGELKPIVIETDVHPGFMTDWQQPFVLLMTQANGISIVHETVYEKRFGYIDELKKMGAEVELYDRCLGSLPCRFVNTHYHHSAIVKGPTQLHGAEINIPDLRAGFSYLIAGVIAKGESLVHGSIYIDRGYEEIHKKMRELGADIQRI